MRKLILSLGLLVSSLSFTQVIEIGYCTDMMVDHAYTLDYEELYQSQFHQRKTPDADLGLTGGASVKFCPVNRYFVDLSDSLCTKIVYDEKTKQEWVKEDSIKMISRVETDTQIKITIKCKSGTMSNTDTEYGYFVYNKKPRKNEPKFVIYYYTTFENNTHVEYSPLGTHIEEGYLKLKELLGN